MGFGKYLKAAFLYPWHLLAFGGAMGFALLSGHLDVFVPLVLAGEVGYLGFLGTHPKFQKFVEAHDAKEARSQADLTPQQQAQRLLAELPPPMVQRFESLRRRCQELQDIAARLRDPSQGNANEPLEEMQLAGLERLLWTFLRLLYSQHMLQRFLNQTDEAAIRRTMDNLRRSLDSPKARPDDPQGAKVRKALEDNIKTSEERLANLQRGRDQAQLLQLEIDRLENKICSLSELAINRQEPGFIAGQVDEVVNGMVQTERTMSELQFATGLPAADEAVPPMLVRDVLPARQ